jgi:putative membrane protein
MTLTVTASSFAWELGHQRRTDTADGLGAPEWVAVALTLVVSTGYLAAGRRLQRRGDSWPLLREASFILGSMAVLAALLVQLPVGEFIGHMAQHLLVGMAAPLLLVLGRPLTLALRALPVGEVRRLLLKVVHSRAAAVVVFPPVAGLLDVGGLWLLYRTTIFAETHERPWLHAAVHAHVLVAGVLFTSAVCQLEPVRRRYSLTLRASSLVAAAAAHAVLAKSLYATPPPGTHFPIADVARGAQLMYYGGDLIEVAIALVVAMQWYAATGRALTREAKPRVRAHVS